MHRIIDIEATTTGVYKQTVYSLYRPRQRDIVLKRRSDLVDYTVAFAV